MLDKYEWKNTVFLQLSGAKKDRVTILPFQVEARFLGKFRQGMGSIHGPTQEYAGKWLKPAIRVEMKPCQNIEAENIDVLSPQYDKTMIICTRLFRDRFNDAMTGYGYKEGSMLLNKIRWGLLSPASHNVWFAFERIEYSYNLICGGVNIK